MPLSHALAEQTNLEKQTSQKWLSEIAESVSGLKINAEQPLFLEGSKMGLHN
jgi:hypothetical protein